MDTKFYRALTSNDMLTENGMPTHSTSSSKLVDLFYSMGACRAKSDDYIIDLFSKAFYEDKLNTLKALFYNRDIRAGQGERRTFRVFFHWLCENYPKDAIVNLTLVPEYGRWDDLFVAFGTPVEPYALDLILKGIRFNDKLLYKWLPREGKKTYANEYKTLITFLNIDPGTYRRLLAGHTEVVETLMCKNQWAEINYSHVPSVASNKYRKAFMKHDPERYKDWVGAVEKGEAKVNASAIYPSDIVHKVIGRNLVVSELEKRSAQIQWKALPDYMPKGKRILPVCDTSGSMAGQPMEVAVALSIYLAERNEGPFKDLFITFSERPQLQKIVGKDIFEKVRSLLSKGWGYNTNFEAVFNLILSSALESKLSAEDMPEYLLVLSDMQFDQAMRGASQNAFTMIKNMYSRAGYEMPKIIFWNLRDSNGVPVKFDQNGTALVSGYSPSIMQNILSADFNPLAIIMKVLIRYDKVRLG